MKILIVEDEFTSRQLLQEILKIYGATHIAVDGQEAVEAFRTAVEADEPYDLVCLDIMMPRMDGQAALKEIRRIEQVAGIGIDQGAKIVMTTALDDQDNVFAAFCHTADAYLLKPFDKAKFLEHLRDFGLIPESGECDEASSDGGRRLSEIS